MDIKYHSTHCSKCGVTKCFTDRDNIEKFICGRPVKGIIIGQYCHFCPHSNKKNEESWDHNRNMVKSNNFIGIVSEEGERKAIQREEKKKEEKKKDKYQWGPLYGDDDDYSYYSPDW